jgi:hypothetical protein
MVLLSDKSFSGAAIKIRRQVAAWGSVRGTEKQNRNRPILYNRSTTTLRTVTIFLDHKYQAQ